MSGTEGVHSFGVNGLALNADLSGAVQILNQATGGTPPTSLRSSSCLEGVGIYSTDASWTFQLPIYAEPGATGFTTLRPSVQAGQGGGGAEYLLDLDSTGSRRRPLLRPMPRAQLHLSRISSPRCTRTGRPRCSPTGSK